MVLTKTKIIVKIRWIFFSFGFRDFRVNANGLNDNVCQIKNEGNKIFKKFMFQKCLLSKTN